MGLSDLDKVRAMLLDPHVEYRDLDRSEVISEHIEAVVYSRFRGYLLLFIEDSSDFYVGKLNRLSPEQAATYVRRFSSKASELPDTKELASQFYQHPQVAITRFNTHPVIHDDPSLLMP
jgi:phosphoserine phosphatase